VFEPDFTSITSRDEGAAFVEPVLARPAVLLHTCCGPCSTAVIERLSLRFRIALFFCNSNIDDEAEYKKRLETQKQYVEHYNASDKKTDPVDLICAPYRPDAFLKLIAGKEECEEGGERCRLCIHDRLEKTAVFAVMNSYEFFSTTLSVSRHKNIEMILELGYALALKYSLSFIGENFKKNGGEQRSIELAKAYGLERQDYCGCSFSKSKTKGDVPCV